MSTFLRDPDTGHMVGIEQKPHVSAPGAEWPKWVTPHASHIVTFGDSVTVPGFSLFEIMRDNTVKVLVDDEAEEAMALAAKQPDDVPEPPAPAHAAIMPPLPAHKR